MISIIVPAFNSERTIAKCLDSILVQTYRDLEIIVVDDGSTDNTKIILDTFVKRDDRVRLISQNNRGSFAARNRGIKAANSEWIGFVDSDDWIEPDMYEAMMTVATDDIDWIETGAYVGEFDNRKKYRSRASFGRHIVDEFIEGMIYDLECNRPWITQAVWNKIFRKSLLLDVLENLDSDKRISLGDDAILTYLSALKSKGMYFIEDIHYQHIDYSDSLCTRTNMNVFNEIKLFQKTLLDQLSYHVAYQKLERQLSFYLVHLLDLGIRMNFQIGLKKSYTLIDIDRFTGLRVAVYGCGAAGKGFVRQIQEKGDIELVGIADKYKYGETWMGYQIVSVMELISKEEFDYIIIANTNERMAEDIKSELLKCGIEEEKLYWERPISGCPLHEVVFL